MTNKFTANVQYIQPAFATNSQQLKQLLLNFDAELVPVQPTFLILVHISDKLTTYISYLYYFESRLNEIY